MAFLDLRERLLIGRPPLAFWAALGAGALSYFLAAQLGLYFATAFKAVSPIWPASGLAVALLLQFGLRHVAGGRAWRLRGERPGPRARSRADHRGWQHAGSDRRRDDPAPVDGAPGRHADPGAHGGARAGGRPRHHDQREHGDRRAVSRGRSHRAGCAAGLAHLVGRRRPRNPRRDVSVAGAAALPRDRDHAAAPRAGRRHCHRRARHCSGSRARRATQCRWCSWPFHWSSWPADCWGRVAARGRFSLLLPA